MGGQQQDKSTPIVAIVPRRYGLWIAALYPAMRQLTRANRRSSGPSACAPRLSDANTTTHSAARGYRRRSASGSEVSRARRMSKAPPPM